MSDAAIVAQKLYTVEEACEVLDVGRSTLYGLIRERRIPFRRIGSRGVKFTQADLDEIIANSLQPVVAR